MWDAAHEFRKVPFTDAGEGKHLSSAFRGGVMQRQAGEGVVLWVEK